MKLIMIKTHGFNIIEGTRINLINEMSRAFAHNDIHSAFLYNNEGVCMEARTNRFRNGIHVMMQVIPE